MKKFYKYIILFFFILYDGCRSELSKDEEFSDDFIEENLGSSNRDEKSLLDQDLSEKKYEDINTSFFDLLPVDNLNLLSHFSYQRVSFLSKVLNNNNKL